MSASEIEKFISEVSTRLEVVEAKLGIEGTKTCTQRKVQQASENVFSFEPVLNKATSFCENSARINQELGQMAADFKACFNELQNLLAQTSKTQKPEDETSMQEFLSPLLTAMKNVQNHRRSIDHVNHEKSILEGLNSLMWINPSVGPPCPYIESFRDASVFYANKVRVSFKNKENGELHLAWCKSLNDVFQALLEFVKQNHKTGVSWSQVSSIPSSSKTSETPSVQNSNKNNSKKGGSKSIFDELSRIDQSSGKTAGLRHVTADMKSKNQKDRTSVVPSSSRVATGRIQSNKPEIKKDPVMELKGQKWTIEYQRDNVIKTIGAEELDIKHSVYIFKCHDATIVLKGKCNTVSMDDCHNVQLLFDNLISSCEIVNCHKVKIQCNENVPSVVIDKSDGVTVYLMNRDMLNVVKFTTSKSSEMNISWPSENEEEGFVEQPIPEQFISHIRSDTIQTNVSDLYKH